MTRFHGCQRERVRIATIAPPASNPLQLVARIHMRRARQTIRACRSRSENVGLYQAGGGYVPTPDGGLLAG